MNRITGFIILLFLSTIYSFSQDIQVTSNQGCIGLQVDFQYSIPSPSYYWDFGNGASSESASPSTTYNQSGTFDVVLQDKVGGTILAKTQIFVFDSPKAKVVASVNKGCSPFEVTFTDSTVLDDAINITGRQWALGDGTGDVDAKSISKTYTETKAYTVSLSFTTNFPTCNVRIERFENIVEVINPPSAVFTTNSQLVSCKDSIDMDLINNSTGVDELEYTWKLNGDLFSNEKTPENLLFKENGKYLVSLDVNYLNSKGCTSSNSLSASIGTPTITKEDIKYDSIICFGNTGSFRAFTNGNVLWQFDETAARKVVGSTAFSNSFTSVGNKEVSVSVTSIDGQCTSSPLIFNVLVSQVEASFKSTPEYSCTSPVEILYEPTVEENDNFIYEWFFYDKTKSNLINPSKIYSLVSKDVDFAKNGFSSTNNNGYYETQLKITDTTSGCSDVFTKADTVWLINSLFTSDTLQGCAPLDVVFTEQSSSDPNFPVVEWEYFFGDGTLNTKANNSTDVAHTFQNAGEYEVFLKVTNSLGCSDSSFSIKVIVGEDLSGDLDFTSSKTDVCRGETFVLTNTSTSTKFDYFHFRDSLNVFTHSDGSNDVSVSFDYATGPQDVELEVNNNGCLSKIIKEDFINVKGSVAQLDYFIVCDTLKGVYLFDKSLAADSVKWSFGDGNDSIVGSGDTIFYMYEEENVEGYNIVLETISEEGCTVSKDSQIVIITIPFSSFAILDAAKDTTLELCANIKYEFNADSSRGFDPSSCKVPFEWFFKDEPNRRQVRLKPSSDEFSFTNSGYQTVELVVYNHYGCTDTSEIRFKVFDITDFSLTSLADKVCNPDSVDFKLEVKSDTSLVSWEFNFGDAESTLFTRLDDTLAKTSTISKERKSFDGSITQEFDTTFATVNKNYDAQASHYYVKEPLNQATSYLVNVTVRDSLGCVENTTVNVAYYIPNSTISIKNLEGQNDNKLCLNDTAIISASDFTQNGSKLIYHWNYGNGEVDSLISTRQVTYNEKGDFKIRVDFEEEFSGCPNFAEANLSVQTYPVAGFTPGADSLKTLCNSLLVFKDTSVSEFPLTTKWFHNAKLQVTSNTTTPTLVNGENVILREISTSNGCMDTVSVTFRVVQPTGSFTINKSTICKGEEIEFELKGNDDVTSYSLDFGDGEILVTDKTKIKHNYVFHPESGSTVASLTFYGPDTVNCNTALEKTINIHRVVADFKRMDGLDTAQCLSLGKYSLSNQSKGADSFVWNFGNGETNSSDESFDYVFKSSGQFNVSLSVKNEALGCTDSISKVVIIHPDPKLAVSSDTICKGDLGEIRVVSDTTGIVYEWNGAKFLTVLGDKVTHKFTESEIVSITATDTNTCFSTIEEEVQVIQPIDLADWDTTIVAGDYATLPVEKTDLYIFKWSPSDDLTCLECSYPKVNPLKDKSYGLNVTDIKGCFDDQFTFMVNIFPETFVKMPTTFSPNGDHVNDVIYVKGWGIKELVQFEIYNRWGELIYSSNDIEEGWDGTYNGLEQNSDVYVYKVKIINYYNEEMTDEGHFNLIH